MSTTMISPIAKPMPLADRSCQSRRVGTLYRDSVMIFVHERALEEILDYSQSELQRETGGFLIGGVYEDGQSYIEIENYLPAIDTLSSSASLTFTHETWARANSEVHERFPKQRIVGWHHTHPGLGLFFSEYDLFIHRNFFSAAWQVAMVVDPREGEFVFYQWRGRGFGDESAVETVDGSESRSAGQLTDCGFVCVTQR